MSSAFDWRTATDEEVERQYSPSRFSKRPIEDYLREYADLSAGAGEPRSLCHRGRPMLLYVHGGYWQRLSAADSLFNAADARRHQISLAAVEYTLAPQASIEQIIEECVDEVRVLIEEYLPSRVVVAGCSAGAHLVASCLQDSSIRSAVDGAVMLSGIYDLRPLVRTSTNGPLGLDEARAERLSAMFMEFDRLGSMPPCLVAVGSHESTEFIRQSREFAARVGTTPALVVQGRDHFDLPYELLDADTAVGEWVLECLQEVPR